MNSRHFFYFKENVMYKILRFKYNVFSGSLLGGYAVFFSY